MTKKQIVLIDEQSFGLASSLCLECVACKQVLSIETSTKNEIFKTYEINVQACFGAIACGNGFTDLETLMGIMSLKNVSRSTFHVIQNTLEPQINQYVQLNMEKWAIIAKNYAIESNNYSSQGVPAIRAQIDAG